MFTIDERPDGVTLTKPLPAMPLTSFAAGLVAAAVAATTVLLLYTLLFYDRATWPDVVLGSLACVGLACLCTEAGGQAWALARPRTLVISLDAGKLRVAIEPTTWVNRPWTQARAGRFRAGGGTPDVTQLRVTNQLLVRTRFGLDHQVMARVPMAECRWLADVLNAARDRTSLGRSIDGRPSGR